MNLNFISIQIALHFLPIELTEVLSFFSASFSFFFSASRFKTGSSLRLAGLA